MCFNLCFHSTSIMRYIKVLWISKKNLDTHGKQAKQIGMQLCSVTCTAHIRTVQFKENSLSAKVLEASLWSLTILACNVSRLPDAHIIPPLKMLPPFPRFQQSTILIHPSQTLPTTHLLHSLPEAIIFPSIPCISWVNYIHTWEQPTFQEHAKLWLWISPEILHAVNISTGLMKCLIPI